MGRSAWDFSDHGLQNIRAYVRNFELPKPDAICEKDLLFMVGRGPYIASDVNKSHLNILQTRHERWRTFENIRRLALDTISPLPWTNTQLPQKGSSDHKLALNTDPRYSLPSVLPELYTHAPVSIENLLPWLGLLLTTTTRILHSTLPRAQSFAFQHGVNMDKDKHLFGHYIWSYSGMKPHDPRWDSGSVVVAYQPPFVLTVQDLEEFAACKAFPTFDSLSDPLSSKYRLWAKIWDTCQAAQTNWFILTSYTHWVFGAFSKGMRVAFVSPVICYNKNKPTILERVLYWISSAMGLPGTFRLPQVDEPVFAELDIDMEPVVGTIRPTDSESYWQGKDDAPDQSAHADLRSQLQGEGSLVSSWGMPERANSSATRGAIRTWLATSQNARHRMLDEDDLVYRPVPDAELPENDFREDELRGEWMIPT